MQAWEYFIVNTLCGVGQLVRFAHSHLMVQCWCLIFFQTLLLCLALIRTHDIITLVLPYTLAGLIGDSQYLKLGGGVLYHTSSGWVSLALR